jgi:hypothetical protein
LGGGNHYSSSDFIDEGKMIEFYMIKFFGLILIVDGAWSLQTQKNRHWPLGDAGRWARLMIGVAMVMA